MILEIKLKEIFDQLPAISYNVGSQEYLPAFGFGDKKELVKFLLDSESKANPYPLIWLLYPVEETHSRNSLKVENMTLLLAVNTNSAMMNDERLETTFGKILMPLFENVFKYIQKASTTNLKDEVGVWKFPNYSDDLSRGEQNFTIERWDALKTNWSIEFNNKCLKQIIV